MENSHTYFSVLICTYNRHLLLERALRALIEETQEKPDEVVVVNGGDEKTDRIVEQFQNRHGIELKLIKTVNKNLAASRNIGLPYCSGEIIAMTDDDAEVFPDWVTQMKQLHREHPVAGAVGGPVFPLRPDLLASRLSEKVTFPYWDKQRTIRTLPTVNLSYKSHVIQEVGQQDEELWTGEDVDFNWRMIKKGYIVLYDPSIKAYHHHPETIRDLWFKHYTYGRGYYLLRSKWSDMYCIYPHNLRSSRDFLKLGNYFASLVYQPVATAISMEKAVDKIITAPIQFINQLLWRTGIIIEFIRFHKGFRGR